MLKGCRAEAMAQAKRPRAAVHAVPGSARTGGCGRPRSGARARQPAYRAEPYGHRGDRDQQGPEGGRGHRAQHLVQGAVAAAQPGGREQPDADMGGEQQPGGGRVGLREQGGGTVAAAAGHVGQRGAHAAAAAQHVEADRAQRARDGAPALP